MKNSKKIELNMKNKRGLAWQSHQARNPMITARAVFVMQISYIHL